MSDGPMHTPGEDTPPMMAREDLLSAILEAGLSNLIITEPLNHDSMVWYRELISRSESHPDNKARVAGNLLTLTGSDEEEQREIFERYKRDYSDFYESQKPCIAQIALKSGPLFVRFNANERKQFQDIVGLIPEELLDTSKSNDMFLYSMSEAV